MESEIKIQDFILETNVKDAEETSVKNSAKGSDKSEDYYETIFASGPDFIIKRKTKIPLLLVCLFSQNQFYIKKEKTGEIQQLELANLKSFFIKFPKEKDFVIKTKNNEMPTSLYRAEIDLSSKTCVENFIRSINDPLIVNSVKEGYGMINVSNGWRSRASVRCDETYRAINYLESIVAPSCKTVIKTAKKIGPEIATQMFNGFFGEEKSKKQVALSKLYCCLCETTAPQYPNQENIRTMCLYLIDRFGTEVISEILEATIYSNASSFCYSYTLRSFFDVVEQYNINLDKQSFVTYLVHEACAQGCADNIDNFVCTWRDFLSMQMDYYGKIKEKYPKNLFSKEIILAANYKVKKNIIDAEKFIKIAENRKKYEYKSVSEGFIIKVPETIEDVLDEAQQQSNCLASYVDKIIEGYSEIFFLRDINNPDTSLVTFEINGQDDKIVQIKRQFNKEPSMSEKAFVYKWFTDVYLKRKYQKDDANEDTKEVTSCAV